MVINGLQWSLMTSTSHLLSPLMSNSLQLSFMGPKWPSMVLSAPYMTPDNIRQFPPMIIYGLALPQRVMNGLKWSMSSISSNDHKWPPMAINGQ